MVADPLEYPWSSHAANARGPDSSLLTPHPQLLSLGPDPSSRRAAYRTLFDEALDSNAVGAIRDATRSPRCSAGASPAERRAGRARRRRAERRQGN